ncbi:MAG: type IV pili methyl-accepting chemotaxis transducer N-terminal domain-containing protein, partial [Nevskia sp.]|nr:type IV pili methyl-accepting chemotaxis transducer N-terminal domain-containing protein [Nevskia sp.]
MADSAYSRQSGSRRQFLPLVFAIVLILIAGAAFGWIQLTGNRDRTWNELARQFPADAETLVNAGRSAQPDFATLSALSGNFDDNIQALRQGDSVAGIVAAPSSVQPQVEALAKSWGVMRQSIRDMLANEKAFKHIADSIDTINAAADASSADYDQVTARLGTKGAGAATVLAASQMVKLEKIKSSVARIVYSPRSAQGTPDSLSRLATEFSDYNKQLQDSAGADATVDAALRK